MKILLDLAKFLYLRMMITLIELEPLYWTEQSKLSRSNWHRNVRPGEQAASHSRTLLQECMRETSMTHDCID